MPREPETPVPASSLRRSLVLITLGGMLCMVFITGVNSPAQTEFFRAIGANEIHFGLLGGIPMVMLAMQFVGALAANRLRRRKPLFLLTVIAGRLVYLPLILVPLLFPHAPGAVTVPLLIAMLAASAALIQFITPVWFSWMADLVPHRVLSSYWGVRHRWTMISWSASFLAVTAFLLLVHLPITQLYAILVVAGVVAGVMDILLFTWVEEPPNTTMSGVGALDTLLEPLRHADFRSFLVFQCVWSASTMFVAAFMQLYVLREMHLPVWQANLAWCALGIGSALTATLWGRVSDRRGHKPVLALCVAMKPVVVVVFFFLTPDSAPILLPVVFLIDSIWNAGIAVASNGYMLKIAPQQNRSMFVAAITGLAGICGGLASIAGGAFLRAFSDFSITAAGRTWTNFHLLFAVGFAMRVVSAVAVHWIREPRSASTGTVLHDLFGVWPLRVLRFPVGLYRRADSAAATGGSDSVG